LAQNQAVCDGSVIDNPLHDLYSVAYGSTLSFIETCHFSFVCDMQYVEVWVHWRESGDTTWSSCGMELAGA
jgi:hypothetical protein